jgi:hypothetical protein
MTKTLSSLVLSLLLLSGTALAHPEHKAPPMPKEFDALKALVGTWEGTSSKDGKEEHVAVEYKLTSAGTALVETLMPGTPNEMVSIYHRYGKTLAMTHYCALGNQPQMNLVSSDATSSEFKMTKPIGITSPKEPHMHAVKLTYADADTLKQEWTHYMNGKSAGSVVFTYKRKK